MLEMCNVMSVLEENTKPSSPVWCVWTLTVRIISNNMRVCLKERNTKWLMPRDDCRRWSARNMRSSLRFSVALTRNVYVCCVQLLNIKTMTLCQLQTRGQRNRYLKLNTDEILLTLLSYVYIGTHTKSLQPSHCTRQQKWTAAARRIWLFAENVL